MKTLVQLPHNSVVLPSSPASAEPPMAIPEQAFNAFVEEQTQTNTRLTSELQENKEKLASVSDTLTSIEHTMLAGINDIKTELQTVQAIHSKPSVAYKAYQFSKPYFWTTLKWAVIAALIYGVYVLGGAGKSGTDTKPTVDPNANPPITVAKDTLAELPVLTNKGKNAVVQALEQSVKAIENEDYIPGATPQEYLTYFVTGADGEVIKFVQKYLELKEKAKKPLVAETSADDVKKNYQTLRSYMTK